MIGFEARQLPSSASATASTVTGYFALANHPTHRYKLIYKKAYPEVKALLNSEDKIKDCLIHTYLS